MTPNENSANPPELSQLGQMLEQVTIRSIDDVHDAAIALNDIAREREYRVALSDDIASNEPMIDADGGILNAEIFGWMDEGERWWEDHRLALHSPLPRACRYKSEIFWCNAAGFYGHWPNHYLEDIDLRKYFAETSTSAAYIVVPMHLPFAQISASSFSPLDKSKDDLAEDFEEHGVLFGLLTRRFIAGYVACMRKTRRIPSDCELSKREVECLRWAAIGKTDKEVGMIISLSHATVRYHIHRAGEKLDSVNRAQTIFKAGQLGYLGASD